MKKTTIGDFIVEAIQLNTEAASRLYKDSFVDEEALELRKSIEEIVKKELELLKKYEESYYLS